MREFGDGYRAGLAAASGAAPKNLDEAWQRLVDDLHAEFDQGHLAVYRIVEKHRDVIEAEVASSHDVDLQVKVRQIPEPRPESAYGGTYPGGWYAARAEVLRLLSEP